MEAGIRKYHSERLQFFRKLIRIRYKKLLPKEKEEYIAIAGYMTSGESWNDDDLSLNLEIFDFQFASLIPVDDPNVSVQAVCPVALEAYIP